METIQISLIYLEVILSWCDYDLRCSKPRPDLQAALGVPWYNLRNSTGNGSDT